MLYSLVHYMLLYSGASCSPLLQHVIQSIIPCSFHLTHFSLVSCCHVIDFTSLMHVYVLGKGREMLAQQLWSAVVMNPKKITGRMQVPSTARSLISGSLLAGFWTQQAAVLSERAKNPLYIISTARLVTGAASMRHIINKLFDYWPNIFINLLQ